jgi:D-alanyl-D-alanine carboxypeptidase
VAARQGQFPRRRIAAIAAAVVAVLATAGCTTPVEPTIDYRQVESSYADEVAASLDGLLAQAVRLSGSSGGLAGVWSPWSGSWTGAVGTVGFDEGAAAVTADTGFHLTTITTEITCTVLARLVDAGVVEYGDEVAELMGDLPGADGITLEQLCRHTSGLADYYPTLRRTFLSNPQRIWSERELVASGMAIERVGPPGAQWSYSRTGILLLAEALEERTGRSWSELAEQYVLGPLELEQTSMPEPEDVRTAGMLGGFSAGLLGDGSADCAVSLDVSAKSSSMGGAAAGAVSTLQDTKRLSEAFATGALLTEATARRVWDTVTPGSDVPSWYAQGLGGMQYGPLRGTAGETAGSLAAAFTDPETGLTVVVTLDNSTSGASFVREVAFALASIGSKAAPAPDREMPLVELPWSLEQATAKMNELAVCPLPEEPAAG